MTYTSQFITDTPVILPFNAKYLYCIFSLIIKYKFSEPVKQPFTHTFMNEVH